MASTIKLKRSLTPGSVPGSLAAGELAINIPDKKLFSSNGSSVFNVSGDQYNFTSSTSDQGKAVLTLNVDNAALSNDSVEFHGGTGIIITRNANSSISIASTGNVAQAETANTATSAETANTATTAGGLANVVSISLTGHVTGTATFQNGGDTATINTTVDIQPNSVDLGTDTVGNYIATVAAGPGIDVAGSGTETAAVTVGLAATIAANTTGNAATATQLATTRAIAVGGDLSGTANFDGTQDITISATIGNDAVALGTQTTGNYASSVTGTANEIEVTGTAGEGTAFTVGLTENVIVPNNLTVTGNTALAGDLTVDGNLEVNGTLTYIDSTTVTIGDNMLKLANTNTADTIDIGFYSLYNSGGNKYTGLVRDATDGAYYLFDNLSTEPGQTINFGATALSTLNAVIDGGTF